MPGYISSFQDDRRFSQTKNSVYVIKAFIEAHEKGTCPPPWALNFVAKVFKEFDDSKGKKELNKLLGFKKGKGQSPAYIEYFTEKRYKLLCMDVFKLVKFLRMSIDDACYLVACKLEEETSEKKTSDYDMGIMLKKITEETIRDKYYKMWGKKFKNSSTLMEHIKNTPPKDRVKFLKKFPPELVDSYKDIYPAINAYL